MKYVSLDIETTGLTPKTCYVLEIGALIEDTEHPLPRNELPTFHAYIWKETYQGEPYALAMNAHIFTKILELRKSGDPSLWILDGVSGVSRPFGQFLANNFNGKRAVVAGKNVSGFDLPFLTECIPGWAAVATFHHRVIDPGMMYFNPLTDMVPPDLKECKKRAGLSELVTHEALDDAWDVIQLVRAKFPRSYE